MADAAIVTVTDIINAGDFGFIKLIPTKVAGMSPGRVPITLAIT